MCEWHEDSQNLSFPENYPRHLKRPYGHGELVADGLVHVAAILAGIVGMTTLFRLVAIRGGIAEGLAIAVYAAGFFSMFGFSLAYNMTPPSPLKWLLRRFDHSTPIRLTHSPSRCSVIPVAGIKLGIGRRLCVASDAEQRTEGVERVEAPVEPKREFVEVGL